MDIIPPIVLVCLGHCPAAAEGWNKPHLWKQSVEKAYLLAVSGAAAEPAAVVLVGIRCGLCACGRSKGQLSYPGNHCVWRMRLAGLGGAWGVFAFAIVYVRGWWYWPGKQAHAVVRMGRWQGIYESIDIITGYLPKNMKLQANYWKYPYAAASSTLRMLENV